MSSRVGSSGAFRRRGIDLTNGVAVALALILSVLFASRCGGGLFSVGPTADASLPVERLVDAAGQRVPIRHYRRIASVGIVADRLLLELSEPDRIVAFTRRARHVYQGYRFSPRKAVLGPGDIERLLALQPDLVLINKFTPSSFRQALRRAGIQTFDLGGMYGLPSLVKAIERVGALVGRAAAGRQQARRFVERLESIARRLPSGTPQRSAIYLGLHGGTLTGGSRGTSFHEILRFAGLRDAAAATLSGWPRMSAETVLAIDPEVILTQTGMARRLCQRPGFAKVRACRPGGQLVELPAQLLVDPGLPILEAAERLYAAVYGQQRQRRAR
ncbi:MAG: ABC transporter substrate-binding protein [Deltaproteobacteria bacterium]|nr:ABC transporter substrate-binding protein [Deltaproteobacteria bacterium]